MIDWEVNEELYEFLTTKDEKRKFIKRIHQKLEFLEKEIFG